VKRSGIKSTSLRSTVSVIEWARRYVLKGIGLECDSLCELEAKFRGEWVVK
jgi:hypothetical protein